MRKILIVGNWKMHLNVAQSSVLLHHLDQHIKGHRDIEVVLAPSMLALQPLSLQLDRRKFRLCAQNAYPKDEGAYTGEVSFSMLRDMVHYALVGHSERRHVFGESLSLVRDKVAAAVRNDIVPILCIGETKNEKLMGETSRVLHDQLTTAIANLTAVEVEDLVIAYEPVWAISSGSDYQDHEVAKPDEVEKVVRTIRHNVGELYGTKAAERIRVLYGGSSNAENAAAYLRITGIDGLLPGGASLNYHEFSKMVDSAQAVLHKTEKRTKDGHER
jgi:triosephosphate isomerase